MGVECPKGYSLTRHVCAVCDMTFILTRAACWEPDFIECPCCGGATVEIELEDDEDEQS